jgi:hypothetical protein
MVALTHLEESFFSADEEVKYIYGGTRQNTEEAEEISSKSNEMN